MTVNEFNEAYRVDTTVLAQQRVTLNEDGTSFTYDSVDEINDTVGFQVYERESREQIWSTKGQEDECLVKMIKEFNLTV